jgi:hypothetical protein
MQRPASVSAPQLAQDVMDVDSRRAPGDAERGGDLAIAPAEAQQSDHLLLAPCQRLARGRG